MTRSASSWRRCVSKPAFPRARWSFCILTATRTNEVLGAQWDEIDLANALSSIPGERMKRGNEHRVPLSAAAVARSRIWQLSGATNPYSRNGAARMKPRQCSACCKAWGEPTSPCTAFGPAFAIGIRAHELPEPRGRAGAGDAHPSESRPGAVYRRGDLFFQKRRKLMQAWADYCAKPQTYASGGAAAGRFVKKLYFGDIHYLLPAQKYGDWGGSRATSREGQITPDMQIHCAVLRGAERLNNPLPDMQLRKRGLADWRHSL